MGRTEAKQWTAIVAMVPASPWRVGGCGGSKSDKAGGAQTHKPVVLTMANGNSIPVELEPLRRRSPASRTIRSDRVQERLARGIAQR